jgi:GNAT superfamily N-acetyltransferase
VIDDVEIRLCTTGDLDALETALPSQGTSRFHHQRLLEQLRGTAAYLVAWEGDAPVGHLNLRWHSAEIAVRATIGDVPEVNALAVATPRRNLGIGTALIHAAHWRARGAGHHEIGLAVNVDNTDARRLYARLGYDDWGHGELDLCWTVTDDDGRERIVCEHCAYLLKTLEAGGNS